MVLAALAVWPAFGQIAPGARPEPLDIPIGPATPPGTVDLKVPPPSAKRLVLSTTVLVRAFRFSGLRSVHEDELRELLSPWTGRQLTGDELNRVAEAVTNHLRAGGLLVAQAFVPAQEIQDGVVEIGVLEGRIGAVALEVLDGVRLRPGVAERFLDSIRPDETIRRDNVEHSLLLLNDLPGTRLDASLEAGTQPDTADLRVRVRDDGNRIAGTLALDNAGLRATGENRADLNVRVRSPLNLGDLLTARYLQSSGAGQTLASLTYGLPVNSLGTRVGLRVSEQRYHLRKEFTPLDANGEYRAVSILASHPLLRRSDGNLSLAASYSQLEFQDRVGAVNLASDSRHRVTGLGLLFDNRDRWLGGGANLLQVQQLMGRASQSDPFYSALDTAPGGLNVYGRYAVTRLRAQREQALDSQWSMFAAVNGQMASRNLDAGSELAVGGPEAVRGYPVGELYADEGFVARFELRRRFALSDDSRTVVAAFLDQARVRVNRNPLSGDPANRRGLGAYGLGVAHAAGENIRIQTWLAWRTGEPPTAAPDRSPRIWVSLILGF